MRAIILRKGKQAARREMRKMMATPLEHNKQVDARRYGFGIGFGIASIIWFLIVLLTGCEVQNDASRIGIDSNSIDYNGYVRRLPQSVSESSEISDGPMERTSDAQAFRDGATEKGNFIGDVQSSMDAMDKADNTAQWIYIDTHITATWASALYYCQQHGWQLPSMSDPGDARLYWLAVPCTVNGGAKVSCDTARPVLCQAS